MFPYVGLRKSLDLTEQLYRDAKRHPVRLADAAKSWGYKPTSSSTLRVAAALNSFGLTEESGSGTDRQVKVSEEAQRILEDNRAGVRQKLLREAALKPASIAKYVHKWRDGRPSDQIALSDLKFDGGFTSEGAAKFLRVFDETKKFVDDLGLEEPVDNISDDDLDRAIETVASQASSNEDQMPKVKSFRDEGVSTNIEDGERVLLTGILSRDTSFRLLTKGPIGPKEINKLIAKLEIDKDILAEPDEGESHQV